MECPANATGDSSQTKPGNVELCTAISDQVHDGISGIQDQHFIFSIGQDHASMAQDRVSTMFGQSDRLSHLEIGFELVLSPESRGFVGDHTDLPGLNRSS